MEPGLGLPITAERVQQICALDDPVLRNLWITTAYHDYARRLAAYLHTDATWCAFAVWASKTAGASIRGDELPNTLRDLLENSARYRESIARAQHRTGWLERFGIARVVGHLNVVNVVGDSANTVARAIAEGNLLVFDELAPIFLALCEHLESGGAQDAATLEGIVTGVLDAQPVAPDRVGVELAFACYAEAIAATDPDLRAELVLAGNIAAVAHEQQRLQPMIEQALDAALDVALPDMVLDLTPKSMRGFVTCVSRRPLQLIASACNDAWDTVTTDVLMRFQTADETLHLDHDLPRLPDGNEFPSALVELECERVREQWSRWRDQDSAKATDWEKLDVRMNFIVHLFRSRQQHPPLLHCPYTDAQLKVMGRGEVPDPPL